MRSLDWPFWLDTNTSTSSMEVGLASQTNYTHYLNDRCQHGIHGMHKRIHDIRDIHNFPINLQVATTIHVYNRAAEK